MLALCVVVLQCYINVPADLLLKFLVTALHLPVMSQNQGCARLRVVPEGFYWLLAINWVV